MKLKHVKFSDLKRGMSNPRVATYEGGSEGSYSSEHHDIVYVNKSDKEVVMDFGWIEVLSAKEFNDSDYYWEEELEQELDRVQG